MFDLHLVTLTLGQLQSLTNTHIRTQVFIESSFGFTGQDYCLILIICISITNIQSPVHDLWPKQFLVRLPIWLWPCDRGKCQSLSFQHPITLSCFIAIKIFGVIALLTLTFDLVTLTFGQLQHLIYINHMCECHQDLTIRSWFVDQNTRCWQTHTYGHRYL